MTSNKYFAVLKVRSAIQAGPEVKGTLKRLRLIKKMSLAVFKATPELRGLLTVVKDYTTFGEISEEFLGEIIKKRGKEFKARTHDSRGKLNYQNHIVFNKQKYKPIFHLNPPIGGFERKGIKKTFVQGGVLGDRKEKIQKLIERML